MTKNSKKNAALLLASAALAMGISLVIAPHALLAQPRPAPRAGAEHDCRGGGPHAHAERTPAERLAHWQQKLNRVSQQLQLTARQTAAAQQILQDTLASADHMRNGTAERTPERRAARHALMQQADSRFTAILTPAQRTQWTTLKDTMRERHGRQGGRGHGHAGRGHDGRGPDGRGHGGAPGQRTEAQRGI